MTRKNKNQSIPGTIYKNGNRYWWKVKLPGEEKTKARPLKPVGASLATTDYNVAVECARMILAQNLLKSSDKFNGKVKNVGELVKVYLDFVDEYYKNTEG